MVSSRFRFFYNLALTKFLSTSTFCCLADSFSFELYPFDDFAPPSKQHVSEVPDLNLALRHFVAEITDDPLGLIESAGGIRLPKA